MNTYPTGRTDDARRYLSEREHGDTNRQGNGWSKARRERRERERETESADGGKSKEEMEEQRGGFFVSFCKDMKSMRPCAIQSPRTQYYC